jgi:hypothetical protein
MAQYELDLLQRLRFGPQLTVQDRLCAIIDAETSATRRWKELEDMSQISRHSWQKTYAGDQRPTVQMLECVTATWPQYAFWLMTGITDIPGGHICPTGQDPWPSTPDELVAEPTDEPWAYLIRLKEELHERLDDDASASLLDPAGFDALAWIRARTPKVNKLTEYAALAWLRYRASVKRKAKLYRDIYDRTVKSHDDQTF